MSKTPEEMYRAWIGYLNPETIAPSASQDCREFAYPELHIRPVPWEKLTPQARNAWRVAFYCGFYGMSLDYVRQSLEREPERHV